MGSRPAPATERTSLANAWAVNPVLGRSICHARETRSGLQRPPLQEPQRPPNSSGRQSKRQRKMSAQLAARRSGHAQWRGTPTSIQATGRGTAAPERSATNPVGSQRIGMAARTRRRRSRGDRRMSDEETEAILAHVERSVIEKVLEATRAEACVRLRQTIANGVARIERICEDAARIDSEAAASLLSESIGRTAQGASRRRWQPSKRTRLQ